MVGIWERKIGAEAGRGEADGEGWAGNVEARAGSVKGSGNRERGGEGISTGIRK